MGGCLPGMHRPWVGCSAPHRIGHSGTSLHMSTVVLGYTENSRPALATWHPVSLTIPPQRYSRTFEPTDSILKFYKSKAHRLWSPNRNSTEVTGCRVPNTLHSVYLWAGYGPSASLSLEEVRMTRKFTGLIWEGDEVGGPLGTVPGIQEEANKNPVN